MNTVPQVLDPFVRTIRTAIQVALAFVSFAAIAPLLVTAIGAPTDSQIGKWLAVALVWITVVAGIITRIMAIPAVNSALRGIGLAGHSGEVVGGGDTLTTFVPVQPAAVDPQR